MDYLYWLSQIEYVEQSLVGNQLYLLSQLLQHGVAVLPGFVLGNNLLRQFLTSSVEFTNLIQELSANSNNINFNDYSTLQSIARRSRKIVEASVIPQQWQREIFQAAQQLNCQHLILQPFFTLPYGEDLTSREFWRSHSCSVHPEAITITLKQVWSELFTARSLLYRQKLGITREATNLAILVRPLENIYASGTIELVDNLIRVRAIWGLPQSLLQGDVEPDEYYLESHTGYMLSRKLGHKNYAYRVRDIPANPPAVNCIETYIPSEAETTSYVLERSQLAVLLATTQNIWQQQPQAKLLVWNATNSNITAEPWQFFFSQLSKQLSTATHVIPQLETPILLAPNTIKPWLTGISAAPGKRSPRQWLFRIVKVYQHLLMVMLFW